MLENDPNKPEAQPAKNSAASQMTGWGWEFNHKRLPVDVPIWRETLIAVDLGHLLASPIYYGRGAKRGNGDPVIVVPGFLGSDHYLQQLSLWLGRIGYKPQLSEIGFNANCPNLLTQRLLTTLDKTYAESSRKVHLIGHSLGGLLSCAAAAQAEEKVASITTLGSPLRGISSHPYILQMSERVRQRIERKFGDQNKDCFTAACSCDAIQSLKRGPKEPIRLMSVYTKSDGIVNWQNCMGADPNSNFEVSGTHCGLVFNAEVYKLLSEWLAQAGSR